MSWNDVCEYVFENAAQVLQSLAQQNAQQVCDSDGCLETDGQINPTQPTTVDTTGGAGGSGNMFLVLMGLMLLYFLLNLLGRRSRLNLTQKARNNSNDRERDTIF